jgi:predicted phage terminase large subunit-like protein
MDISVTDILKAKDDVIDALTQGESLRLSHEAEATLGANNTYYLCKYILGYEKLNNDFHVHICKWYDEHLYEPQIQLHPRGHYKTTMFTVAGHIRLSILYPNITMLILTNTVANAESFIGEAKAHHMENPKFRSLYPKCKIDGMRQAGKAFSFNTPARNKIRRMPTFEAASIDQKIVSRHYDKLHFDDIVDKENTNTAELRRKNRESYTAALSCCDVKTKNGIPWHHVIGTRWHMDDTYHHLLEIDLKENKFHKRLTSAYYKAIDPDTGEKQTKLLFPEEFSFEQLEYIKASYERDGSNLFSCLYLNDPVPSNEAVMDPRNLREYDDRDSEFKKMLMNTVMTVDPAPSSAASRGDPTVISVFSMDSESNIYIREVRRGRWPLHEIIEHIFDAHRTWRPMRTGIEVVSFSRWLQHALEREMMLKGYHFVIDSIVRSSHATKSDRQERCIYPLRNGKVFIRKNEPEERMIKKELREFPRGRYDDFLDTLTDAIELLSPPFSVGKDTREPYRRPPVTLKGSGNFQTGYTYGR